MTDIISRIAELPQRIKTGYGEMKLRTIMVAPDSTSSSWYPTTVEGEGWEGLHHDAAAAHALMLAIKDSCPGWDAQDIEYRADEIMREWGFTDSSSILE